MCTRIAPAADDGLLFNKPAFPNDAVPECSGPNTDPLLPAIL